MHTEARHHILSVSVEGPPGSGKTTLCARVFGEVPASAPAVVLPELLLAEYNCGDSDRLHDIQSSHKERLAAALVADGFVVIMDRCRISTVLMRMTQQGMTLAVDDYRKIEQRIFGDNSLPVGRLMLLNADPATCVARRRRLLGHEPTTDLAPDFYAALHANYARFSALAPSLYPGTEIQRVDTNFG